MRDALSAYDAKPRNITTFGSLGPLPLDVFAFGAINVQHSISQFRPARLGSLDNSTCI